MRKRPDFLVGLTVVLTVVALIASLLWLRQSDPTWLSHLIVALFQDIGNSRVGNAVVIRGVRSGRIQSVELSDDGAVLVHISLDRGVQLPTNPVVLLNESSLFGEWQATVMERASLPRDDEVQRQITAIETSGYIPGATLPDIAKLTTVAGQIAGDVAAVAGRVEVAFDESAAAELRASIKNFATLSTILAQTVREHATDLDTMSVQLQGAVRTLNRTAQTTQAIATRVDSSMTSGELRTLITDLGTAAAELRRATTTINSMTTQLAGTQNRLDSFLTNGDSVLGKINRGQGSLGMLVNDSSLYVSSDSLVTALRGLVLDVRTNPKRYFSLRVF